MPLLPPAHFMPLSPITRFAPSPTGQLHIGHAASALFAWQNAAPNGVCLLRIEDIDQTRCKPEYVHAIYADLAWLGFDWPKPVRIQSDHFADYVAVLDRMREQELIYPCFCTRKDIAAEIERAGGAPHGLDGQLYPNTCRDMGDLEVSDRMAKGEAFAWRLNMKEAVKHLPPLLRWHERGRGWQEIEKAFLLERIGDVVLGRKDCPASYHLCVTHDDALQEITLVTRGEDLFEATHLHVLLQHLNDWPTPDYKHHSMLLDAEGKRFAKRNQSVTLQDLRERGVSPLALQTALIDGSWPKLIA